jgi:hypothetical protein
MQVAVRQLTTAAISDVPGAIKRFQALAELAVEKSQLCKSVCPVLGCCTKDGRQTLMTQIYDRSLQDVLSKAPGMYNPCSEVYPREMKSSLPRIFSCWPACTKNVSCNSMVYRCRPQLERRQTPNGRHLSSPSDTTSARCYPPVMLFGMLIAHHVVFL